MKNINLFFSPTCNWTCSYCNCHLYDDSYNDINYISNMFDILTQNFSPDEINLTLTGGEPGLLDSDILALIRSKLSAYNLEIITNGTFFEASTYFDDFKQAFSNLKFVWHCVTTLNEDIPSYDVNFSGIELIKIIVVGKNDLADLATLVNKYPDDRFFISPLLSLDESERLDQTDLENIKADCENQIINIDSLIDNKDLDEQYCRENRDMIKIDFCNNKIYPCNKLTEAYYDQCFVPLSEENLLAIKNNSLIIGPNDFCPVCPKRTSKP